jgi:hypothetical protein
LKFNNIYFFESAPRVVKVTGIGVDFVTFNLRNGIVLFSIKGNALERPASPMTFLAYPFVVVLPFI